MTRSGRSQVVGFLQSVGDQATMQQEITDSGAEFQVWKVPVAGDAVLASCSEF